MDSELRRQIGGFLRGARLASALRVQDVAQELRRAKGTVMAWETGQSEPTASELRKLVLLYDTPPERLLFGVRECQARLREVSPALFRSLPPDALQCCRTLAPILSGGGGAAHRV